MIKVFIVDASAVNRSIEKKIVQMTSTLKVAGEGSCVKDILDIPFKSIDFIFIEASDRNVIDVERLLLQKRKTSAILILLAEKKVELLRNYNNIFIWKRPDFLSCSSEKIQRYAVDLEKKISEIKASSLFLRSSRNEKKLSLAERHQSKKNSVSKKLSNKYAKKDNDYKVVLMGVSTGGPGTILKLLNSIGKGFPLPILITQHIDSSFEKNLTEWLNSSLDIPVHVAKDGIEPLPGNVYFAPADFHMEIRKNNHNKLMIKLTDAPPVNYLRPAVDKLFISGAETLKSQVISVLLTGMGADGAKGSCELRKQGAYTIGESEETCVIYGMPKAAYDMGGIMELLPLYRIADKLRLLTGCKSKL